MCVTYSKNRFRAAIAALLRLFNVMCERTVKNKSIMHACKQITVS